MRVAIMQPYFFPYVGYFQLIEAADQFIIYDNIQFTKKGWINRNRFLLNGKDALFSVPLEKNSDFLDIKDRKVSASFKKNKLLNQIREAYRQTPYFDAAYSLFQGVLLEEETNLFNFLHNSIKKICNYLAIDTKIVVSSSLQVDHSLQGKDRVIALCMCVGASAYINPIGGLNLYSKEEFQVNGIELKFLKSRPLEYKQYDNEFVPWLSIIDVMMFNSKDKIRDYLKNGYDLI